MGKRERKAKRSLKQLQSRDNKGLDEQVYELLKRIPEGRITTYKALAMALGKPKASRVIGNILKNNPNPVIVPCHRVVRSDGKIGGYAYGKNVKKILLEIEGININNDTIVSFDKIVINDL
ncbi:MAG: MGMT family protein [Candidatus Nitrosothermus koennekii]|nr:MAG: MGMT family protein [Candidatus Nitrosothermus koennekii]